MLEQLMDFHERGLMNLEPYDAVMLSYCAGLVLRGMLGTRTCITKSGKKIVAFYVTSEGRNYLKNI